MTTKVSEPRQIQITPGVQPSADWTASSTQHYTYSKGIRFVEGVAEKIGGWKSQSFSYGATISGTSRAVFTEYINGKLYTLIGTNERLYSLIGSVLTNITPLKTSSVAIANSLSTMYGTLGSNPIATVSGSPVVTVTDSAASRFRAGDTVTLAGATGFAGLSAGDINGDAVVRSVSSGSYTINVGVNATSTTTGGGASVVRSSGIVGVNKAAHALPDGDRVKISGATNFGGILAAQVNKEHIIRFVDANNFDIVTTGVSSSAVSAAGGASTVIFTQIDAGALNESSSQGYGAGLYGVGLYGTALTSSASRSFPRVWHFDRFGNTIVCTPGQQGAQYQWFCNNDVAPAVISGSPANINYSFVSNGILVTFGATNENGIETSDQNDLTTWTSSSINQVFIDDIEGAGRLISHCPAKDTNLIYTENQTYSFRYIGLPLVWEIQGIDDNIGIIAPMARVSVKGQAYWMSLTNFHTYRGGRVEIIPSNSGDQCTALRHVFDNLNWGQKSKIFAWYNPKYDEVWFHYPSASSNEPDRVIKVELKTNTWSIDEISRTAAEWPSVKTPNPYLINVGTLYKHELGSDDDNVSLPFQLTGPKLYNGKGAANITGFIPDSNQTGSVNFKITGYRYPQSTRATYTINKTVTPTTEFIQTQGAGRYLQYDWSGDELGQIWEMGVWYDDVQAGATQ